MSVYIIIRMILKFFWDGVRAQKGREELQGTFVVQLQKHIKLLQLTFKFQPVTAFGFRAGGAHGKNSARVPAGLREQVIKTCSTGGIDGGLNAPAGGHDLHVAFPLEAHLKFRGAIARPNQVGVRVHKTGHEHAAANIQTVFIWETRQQVGCCAGFLNEGIAHQDGTIRDDTQFSEPVAALGIFGQSQ